MGDANLSIAILRTCPIVSSYHDVQPDHHSDTNTLRRWFVVCRPFWSVHGLHGLLGFALLSSCKSLGLTFRTDGYHSIFRPVFQGETVVRCPPVGRLGRGNSRRVTGFLFWVIGRSFVSLGLLVTFACRSRLNNRGGVSGVHTAGRTPTQNYTHKEKH